MSGHEDRRFRSGPFKVLLNPIRLEKAAPTETLAVPEEDPRCSQCSTLLVTPQSLKRGLCLPCLVYNRTTAEFRKASRQSARNRRWLDTFEVYEKPRLQRASESETYDSEPEPFEA